MSIEIVSINRLDNIEEYITDFENLFTQLNHDKTVILDKNYFKDFINNNENALVAISKNSGKIAICGYINLILIYSFEGIKGRVENLVVDKGYRGKNLGKQLLNKLIEIAEKKNVLFIDLTCQEKRILANNLYQSVGFNKGDTNVYRLNLK